MARKKAQPAARKPVRRASKTASASRRIDQRIRDLDDWRGAALARMRKLILAAVPTITEDVKWRGTPVWSHHGIICTGEAYKQVVKLTFAHGASLPDPLRLFNSSLAGNTRRAIDIHEGESVNARAFQLLVKAAAARNVLSKSKPSEPAGRSTRAVPSRQPVRAARKPGLIKLRKNRDGVVLLSGGNPQIARADGDAPVQAYIAAMPGWKSAIGKRIDELVGRAVPKVSKAVRWNSPLYRIEGQGWFLAIHCLAKYVKLSFFSGLSLHPIPPGGTLKSKECRWLDVYETDQLDEAQLTSWLKQAAALPGWVP